MYIKDRQVAPKLSQFPTRNMKKLQAQTKRVSEMEQYVYYSYACRSRNETADEGCETPIAKAPHEKSVILGSFFTPEDIAHIMTQKFVMGSPLYRQEQELNRQGISLSRQTISNWILRAEEDYLTSVYEQVHRSLPWARRLYLPEEAVALSGQLPQGWTTGVKQQPG